MTTLEERRVEALYRCDGRGRLVAVNQWNGGEPPRFFLMRTPAGSIRRYRGDLPKGLVDRLDALSRPAALGDPPTPLPACADECVSILSVDAPVTRVWAGPSFVLPDGPTGDGGCVEISDSNANLLANGFDDWLADTPHRRPFLAAVEDGRAVAVCASVRISPFVHCAGVETLADYRRRGHAARVSAAWAAAVRALGATPCYSTSWDNLPSRALAARLGARLLGVDYHLT